MSATNTAGCGRIWWSLLCLFNIIEFGWPPHDPPAGYRTQERCGPALYLFYIPNAIAFNPQGFVAGLSVLIRGQQEDGWSDEGSGSKGGLFEQDGRTLLWGGPTHARRQPETARSGTVEPNHLGGGAIPTSNGAGARQYDIVFDLVEGEDASEGVDHLLFPWVAEQAANALDPTDRVMLHDQLQCGGVVEVDQERQPVVCQPAIKLRFWNRGELVQIPFQRRWIRLQAGIIDLVPAAANMAFQNLGQEGVGGVEGIRAG